MKNILAIAIRSLLLQRSFAMSSNKRTVQA